MSKLASKAVETGNELTIRQDSGSQAFRQADKHRIADAVHATKPKFWQQAGVGIVVEFNLKAQCFLYNRLDVVIGPFQVSG